MLASPYGIRQMSEHLETGNGFVLPIWLLWELMFCTSC